MSRIMLKATLEACVERTGDIEAKAWLFTPLKTIANQTFENMTINAESCHYLFCTFINCKIVQARNCSFDDNLFFGDCEIRDSKYCAIEGNIFRPEEFPVAGRFVIPA